MNVTHQVSAETLVSILEALPNEERRVTVAQRWTPSQFNAKMRKRGNPFYGLVTRESVYTGMIYGGYGRLINQRRREEHGGLSFDSAGNVVEREVPQYTPLKRTWGERIKFSPFVGHYSGIYLEVFGEKGKRAISTYRWSTGEILDSEEIKELREHIPSKPWGNERQGIEDRVQVFDPKLFKPGHPDWGTLKSLILKGRSENDPDTTYIVV